MSARSLVVAVMAILLGGGCRRAAERSAAPAARVPKGDVIWLFDAEAADDSTLDAELGRLGAAAVFLRAATVGAAAGPRSLQPAAVPAKPFERAPVVLVLAADEALANALTDSDGPDAALAGRVASELGRVIAGGTYGRVAGVHCDFPFAPRAAARYGAFVAALKRGLPAGSFVSISVRALPPAEEDRKRLAPLLEAADALVAFVFGTGPRVDAIAIDTLRRPWWAAYDMRVTGEIRRAGGAREGGVAGRLVEPLSGNPRFQFENDLSSNDGSISAFTLEARAPVRHEGLDLSPGDRIAFRLPSVSEMLSRLGSNLAGKRHALGRAVIFEGASEADRVFDLAALEDVLLGRPLSPELEASVKPAGRNAVAVDLINRSHHASVVSRVANWVEVDLGPAHPADVQVGGFDRYEVYDRAGRPVTPGRATQVRLFETFIAPLETVTPARLLVRGPLPAGCCRYRLHAESAAGPEVATDWSASPVPPTPQPERPKPRRRRR